MCDYTYYYTINIRELVKLKTVEISAGTRYRDSYYIIKIINIDLTIIAHHTLYCIQKRDAS